MNPGNLFAEQRRDVSRIAGVSGAEICREPRWDSLGSDPRFQALPARYPISEKGSGK